MVAEINEADIKKGNCITIMKKMKDESIDLIVSDPPFGVGLDKAGAHKDKWGGDVYSDDTNKVMETLEKAFPEMYRLLKPNSHAYIFFAMTHYVKVLKMLEDSGFQVVLTPIIWNKASQGAPPETPYSYVQTYEPCFLCHKGKRALNEYVTNVLTIPRVPSAKKIHVAQKPVSLLRKFIEASSIAGEIVLDPFMGSGSTVIAAYECKRKAIGIEKDEDMFNKVLLRIQEFKEEYK
jgi:DNA modification methylase